MSGSPNEWPWIKGHRSTYIKPWSHFLKLNISRKYYDFGLNSYRKMNISRPSPYKCIRVTTNSMILYSPTKGYLRETCKSQNINPSCLTLSSPSVSFRS